MHKKLLKLICLTSLFLIYACSESSIEPAPELPDISSFEIRENINSVLSAKCNVAILNATELWIEVKNPDGNIYRTPNFPIDADSMEVPLLGLPAAETVDVQVAAISANNDTARSEIIAFTTGTLPADFPNYELLANNSPLEGFVMLGMTSTNPLAKGYAVILNREAEPMWYREFPGRMADFQRQPNGNYTIYTNEDGATPHFYEVNTLGEVVAEHDASGELASGPHELRMWDDEMCLFAIEMREVDLTSIGGRSNAIVRSTGIEIYRSGAFAFYWDPFEHLAVDEAMPDIPVNTENVNPWHGNAIDIDTDGNLLVSFRNSDMVLKIDSQTGDVLWRFGGKNNEFTITGDPLNGFSHQHGIRRLDNGNVILFDNGNLHNPPVSRAVEYRIDESSKTAEMVWEYRHDPDLFGFALGFADRLENGNTLINFGTAPRIIEVTEAGEKEWDLAVADSGSFVYRAFYLESLY